VLFRSYNLALNATRNARIDDINTSSTTHLLGTGEDSSIISRGRNESANESLNLSARLQWREPGGDSFALQPFVVVNRSWSASARGAFALAGRWSAGAQAWASASTFDNIALSAGGGPGLEFDVWPYAESSRRSLTLAYQVTARRARYETVTLYGRAAETLWRHALIADLSRVEPWGRLDAAVSAMQYLHDGERYRVSAAGSLDLRLARGFALNLGASWAHIRDQLSLPAGDATAEEILARQRLIATSYSWSTSVGLRYTFGSALDNVVNPRMETVYGGF